MKVATSLTTGSVITVFFDGACPLCSREIAHYRRLAHSGSVNWIDISQQADALGQYGLDYETAMSRFHVVDEKTGVHSGISAFLLLWSMMPYYRLLTKFIYRLRLERPLEWLYVHFARWRYARLSDRNCNNGQCGLGTQRSRQEKGK